MKRLAVILGQVVRQRPGGGIAGRGQPNGPDRLGDQLSIRVLRGPILQPLFQFEHPQVVRLAHALPFQLPIRRGRRKELGQALVQPHRPDRQSLLDADVVQDLMGALVSDRGDGLRHVASSGLIRHNCDSSYITTRLVSTS